MRDILNPIVPVLREFYALADWSPAAASFVKANDIDMTMVNAYAGVLAVLPCTFQSGFFAISEAGESSVIVEVYDEDDETVIDLVAFSVADPHVFGIAVGSAAILGAACVVNPATWAFERVLPVYRNPLGWLKSGCDGVVILDHRLAPYILGQALGPLAAEDAAHARALKSMLCRPPVDPSNILVPTRAEVRRVA